MIVFIILWWNIYLRIYTTWVFHMFVHNLFARNTTISWTIYRHIYITCFILLELNQMSIHIKGCEYDSLSTCFDRLNYLYIEKWLMLNGKPKYKMWLKYRKRRREIINKLNNIVIYELRLTPRCHFLFLVKHTLTFTHPTWLKPPTF